MVKPINGDSYAKDYANLVNLMNSSNPDFLKYLDAVKKHNPDFQGPARITDFWHWTIDETADWPELWFYATPPVAEASPSNRILVSGTNVEVRDLDKMIEGFEAYQRVVKELNSRKNGPNMIVSKPVVPENPNTFLTIINSNLPYVAGVKPVYAYASRVGGFWDKFFENRDFLDNLEVNSVPLAIVATGKMRNYNSYGGETINVRERLEEIARDWNVPIKFIESWAP